MRNGDGKTAYELWRILHQMYDPQSAGNDAASVTNILKPQRAKSLKDVVDVIESWEKMLQKFIDVKRRDPLTDDTKMECLFSMLPKDVENYYRKQHRQTPTWDYERVKHLVYDEAIDATHGNTSGIDNLEHPEWGVPSDWGLSSWDEWDPTWDDYG